MSPIRQRKSTLFLGLLVSLAVVLGCSLPGRILGQVSEIPSIEESPPGAILPAGPDLAQQVEGGDLELVDLVASGEIAGPGMRVAVHNPGPEDITATIPCGFFFEPEVADDQRLMVVQPASVVVPAGGEAELTAYVVCIDANSSTPSEGSSYRLGSMVSGDLLKLAQCACGEDLSADEDFMGGLGVMITGWTISEGMTLEDMAAEGAEGAMGDLFSEGMGQVLGMFEGLSTDWFDRCNIPRP